MAIVTLPPLKVLELVVYPTADNMTEPVGVLPPLLLLTVTFTESACVVVMLDANGVTDTVRVAGG
jgi:hypothetical protein